MTTRILAQLACAQELLDTEAAARAVGMGDADVHDELERIRARWFKSAGVVPATIPVREEWFTR